MTRLTELHTLLLSTASQRPNGSLYPLPPEVDGSARRVIKSLTSLTAHGLFEERPATDNKAAHRIEGDLSLGLFITDAGCAAIGVEPLDQAELINADPPCVERLTVKRTTKVSALLQLLQREQGATLAELINTTGWLPHTTRAALTGLRKKGHAVTRDKRDGETCYRAAGQA